MRCWDTNVPSYRVHALPATATSPRYPMLKELFRRLAWVILAGDSTELEAICIRCESTRSHAVGKALGTAGAGEVADHRRCAADQAPALPRRPPSKTVAGKTSGAVGTPMRMQQAAQYLTACRTSAAAANWTAVSPSRAEQPPSSIVCVAERYHGQPRRFQRPSTARETRSKNLADRSRVPY